MDDSYLMTQLENIKVTQQQVLIEQATNSQRSLETGAKIDQIVVKLDRIDSRVDDHEVRISRVEDVAQSAKFAVGVGATALIGMFCNLIVNLIQMGVLK